MGRDWSAVADALNSRLAALGMTQAELVKRSRLAPMTIHELLHNSAQRRRSDQTLAALSRALGWPPGYLRAVAEGLAPDDGQADAPLYQSPLPRQELLEALARGVAAALGQPQPAPPVARETADFLTAGQFAERLGVSRETVRRLAIADVLPHTVVLRGSRKTTRRYPRRFADDYTASGQNITDLAEFATQWRAQMKAEAERDRRP